MLKRELAGAKLPANLSIQIIMLKCLNVNSGLALFLAITELHNLDELLSMDYHQTNEDVWIIAVSKLSSSSISLFHDIFIKAYSMLKLMIPSRITVIKSII